MESALFERLEKAGADTLKPGFAIAPGRVIDILDSSGEGRVKVKISAVADFEVWARVVSVGAGPSRGFCWIPQVDDQVLVGFAQNDLASAYVLGGVWSTLDRPPLALPTDFRTKRVIKTGVTQGVGHEVEFDDLLQSVTITTSTGQKIAIDPTAIEIATTGGAVSVKLDLASQTISLQAPVKIEMKAPQISLEGLAIEIKGTKIDLQAAGPCSVTGLPIKLN